MKLNPGTYNVFNEDGSLMTWGTLSLRVEVTTKRRAHIYIGDNAEPHSRISIPDSITTRELFDEWARELCTVAIIGHTLALMQRFNTQQEAYLKIVAMKRQDHHAMLMGQLPVWRWIEKLHANNELMEVCEELIKELVDELVAIRPELITEKFIVIYTEV